METPAIDAVVYWAQRHLGKTYLVDGALNGCDAPSLPIPQNYRMNTVAQLVDWYTQPVVRRFSLEQALS